MPTRLRIILAVGICWWLVPGAAAQQSAPPGSWVERVSEAGISASFVPDERIAVRFPSDDWHASSEDEVLPPPPGWVAADFASLARSMGSSPESEPLTLGDELTLETGRLASHKDGFFQKFSFDSAWFPRGGEEGLGMVETKTFVTVAVPLPSRDFPLLITPGFGVTSLDGPREPDLPPQLYDAYLDFLWLPKLSERWLGILSVTPGVYSDFDSLQSDSFRIKGKALARYEVPASRAQFMFGVLYLNRHDVNWLPAGGVVWDPHDDVRLELLFPRPKLAYRVTRSAWHEDWAYVAGEFGGDTWSIRRGPDLFDMVTYVDWRVMAGIERKRAGGAGVSLEIGYVFSREIQFSSGTADYRPDDTFMIRGGFDF
jgi:hypothetical protein